MASMVIVTSPIRLLSKVHGCTIPRMTLPRRVDPDAVRFGEILRRERKARGWTLVKLAQRSGMNARYLGVVEAGNNVPSLSTILEVAEVLGADAAEMIREVATARRTPKRNV